MSTDKQQSTIMELIKNLFKKLFGIDMGGGQQKANELAQNLDKLSNVLDEELSIARENDDFIKVMMLERQKCCVDGIKETLEKIASNEINPKIEGGIHKYASDLTEQKIQKMMLTEEFKDGIADYHNHDPEEVSIKSKEVNNMVASTNRMLNFGQLGSTLNTIMRTENAHAEEFLKQPPESHAQEIGAAPSNEQILNERDHIHENQAAVNDEYYSDPKNDPGPGYSS